MKLLNKKSILIKKYLNWFWTILSFILDKFLFSKNQISNDKIESILIFDFHLIGDIVLLIPFLRNLRNNYPFSRITLVAGPWASEILSGEFLVDEVVHFSAPWVKKTNFTSALFQSFNLIRKLNKIHWDIGIDIRGDIRQILMLYLCRPIRRIGFNFMGGDSLLTDIVFDDGTYSHILSHHMRILQILDIKVNIGNFFPRIHLTNLEIISSNEIKPYIGLHFGASMPLRRLPLSEASKILNHLVQLDKTVIIFSPPDTKKYASILANSIPTSHAMKVSIWEGGLRAMVVRLSRAERIFAMDSGVAHISAALGVPTTVLFGPNLPELVRPIGVNVEIKEKLGLSCRPCNQFDCINAVNQFCLLDLIQ